MLEKRIYWINEATNQSIERARINFYRKCKYLGAEVMLPAACFRLFNDFFYAKKLQKLSQFEAQKSPFWP